MRVLGTLAVWIGSANGLKVGLIVSPLWPSMCHRVRAAVRP